MSDISPAALAARPRPGTVFNQAVLFSPLTVADILEWDAWAQGQYRRGARLGMRDGSPEDQLRFRIEANDEAKLICFGSAHAERIECSQMGCLYIAWLSLRHDSAREKMTLDDCARLFGWGSKRQPDQLLELRRAQMEIYVATGLIPEEAVLGLAKPKKNETPAPTNGPSPAPITGATSTDTSGLSTSSAPPPSGQ
jgi:hypothetical protein